MKTVYPPQTKFARGGGGIKTSKFDQTVTFFTKLFIFELDNQAKGKHCNGIKIAFKFLFWDQNVLPSKKINRLIESINIGNEGINIGNEGIFRLATGKKRIKKSRLQ